MNLIMLVFFFSYQTTRVLDGIDGFQDKNKTSRPMLSNSHPTTNANE